MKTYRMQVNAVLCFDIEAENEEQALEAAREACGRLDEGCDCGEPDPEDEATDVIAYPGSTYPGSNEGLDPKVLDVSEPEDDVPEERQP